MTNVGPTSVSVLPSTTGLYLKCHVIVDEFEPHPRLAGQLILCRSQTLRLPSRPSSSLVLLSTAASVMAPTSSRRSRPLASFVAPATTIPTSHTASILGGVVMAFVAVAGIVGLVYLQKRHKLWKFRPSHGVRVPDSPQLVIQGEINLLKLCLLYGLTR